MSLTQEKNSPLVSVIIPLFNAQDFIQETLESVVSQSYQHLEIIVIEDGSEIDSQKIVRAFPQVRYMQQSQQGNSVARNNGVQLATGEFICFLDQDDLFPKDKILHQLTYLQEHPDRSIVSGLTLEFCDPETSIPSWVRSAAKSGPHPGTSPGSCMIRKILFSEAGFFNPLFTMTSDLEWFMKLKKLGYDLEILPEVVLQKRIHQKNQSAHSSLALVQKYHSELLHIFRKAK